jgi:DNA-directed RNA polymerase alpha subunit
MEATTYRALIDPKPELPDSTRVDRIRFPARIRNVLAAAGLTTVSEVREASDKMLLSLPDLGQGSVKHLRETLGLPSSDGVGYGLKNRSRSPSP